MKRLAGIQLCPKGREDGHITHLVLGDDRRTLKVGTLMQWRATAPCGRSQKHTRIFLARHQKERLSPA